MNFSKKYLYASSLDIEIKSWLIPQRVAPGPEGGDILPLDKPDRKKQAKAKVRQKTMEVRSMDQQSLYVDLDLGQE
jgi:hypothetical protein